MERIRSFEPVLEVTMNWRDRHHPRRNTKSNVPDFPAGVSEIVITNSSRNIESVLLVSSPGKKSWVVRVDRPLGGVTLTWMCGVRPG